MNEQFSPFQSVTGLGALKSVHRFNNFFRNGRFIVSGLIMASIFSCICMLAYGLMDDARRGIQSDGLGFTLSVAAFMILLALFIIVYMIWDWLKNRKYAAALYERGLAVHELDGTIQTVTWNEVEYMQAVKLPRSRFRNFNVVTRDGRVLVIYHFLEGQLNMVNYVKQNLSA